MKTKDEWTGTRKVNLGGDGEGQLNLYPVSMFYEEK